MTVFGLHVPCPLLWGTWLQAGFAVFPSLLPNLSTTSNCTVLPSKQGVPPEPSLQSPHSQVTLPYAPRGGHECRLEQSDSLVASNRSPFQLTQVKGASLRSHHELMKLTAGQRKELGNSSRPGNRGHNKPRWTASSTGIKCLCLSAQHSHAKEAASGRPSLGRACTQLRKAL